MVLKPWDERSETSNQLQPIVQQQIEQGRRRSGPRRSSCRRLPGSQGLPVQFVITTTDSFKQLNNVAQQFLQEAIKSGMFMFLDSDLKIDNPQSVSRDRSRQGRRSSD